MEESPSAGLGETFPTPYPVPGEAAPSSSRSMRGIDRPGTPEGEGLARLRAGKAFQARRTVNFVNFRALRVAA